MPITSKSLAVKFDSRITANGDFPCYGFVAIHEIQEEIEWAYQKVRTEVASILGPRVINIVLEKANPNPNVQLVLEKSIQEEIIRILVSSPSVKNSNQKVQELLSNLDLPELIKINLAAYLQTIVSYLNSFRYLRSVVKAHADLFSIPEIEFEKICQNNSLLNKKTYSAKLVKDQLILKDFRINDFSSFNNWLNKLNDFFNEVYALKKGEQSNNFKERLSRGNLLKSGKNNYKKRFQEICFFWYYNEIIKNKKDVDLDPDTEEYKILLNSVFSRYTKVKNYIIENDSDKIFKYLVEKSEYYIGLVSIDGLLVDVNSGKIIQDSITRVLQLDDRDIIIESNPTKISEELKSSFIETIKIQQRVNPNPSRIELSIKNKESYLYIKLEDSDSKDYNQIINLIKLL